ncbi:tripartite motif-containing protein 6-like [Hyperolius riggenbachi]|uniref:tripartite motif-containing protein 6-like n=1 Tax=Hyperolius riggenbachi TaxID=752182 RepID=UPI0035A36EF7
MASADLREELNCSICLSLYTEPVSLRCGHSFCRECLVTVLDTQQTAGAYSCPECREKYPDRPPLEKNRKLSNIAESFRSADLQVEKAKILCTYCVDFPVPATKTCLQCETSMCDRHLQAHNKSVDHILVEPTTSLADIKCSTHKEFLKYYCPQDGVCICMSCWVTGDHVGHKMELLSEAAEKKKLELKTAADQMTQRVREAERRIQDLEDHRAREEDKASAVTRKVKRQFRVIRRLLDDVEKKVLAEISRQEEKMALLVSNFMKELEAQKDKLSQAIDDVADLCSKEDQVTLLKTKLITDDVNTRGDVISDVGCLDEMMISFTMSRGLLSFTDSLLQLKKMKEFPAIEKADIFLETSTANNIAVPQDLRSAAYVNMGMFRLNLPKKFKSKVFSKCSFSSGKHYWEVDVSNAKEWLIGVSAQGANNNRGFENNSWYLQYLGKLTASHDDIHTAITIDTPVQVVGVYLDYKAGRLSFYQLGNPITHLHTFTATFADPLHAAFALNENSEIRLMN